ncbi:SpoIID/LytB domain-containing protein [Leptospira wolffii]|uniref:SpoIID/LytB domain-containing protein n=1 Tax=Leptospira wolffii TaxID=409998 RepID=UPI0010839BE6|nr:SpoIID/LytB domain-containing protein [Leptospira wolffii]TGK58805.1 SpoIID/LytB domain-containing protein [Leptospira wolffii]TGK72632.1 SpoIID/LytB domain-containing protein [Leptospira wolffii]TGK72713.1 SpoIID/LytB domain-containing protein [Leptospira wolffii]TGL26904.1 SpoIID/LytB domain-containing protein [Leptospira wolffii]
MKRTKLLLFFILILATWGCNTVIIKPWNPAHAVKATEKIRVFLGKAESDLLLKADGVIYVYDVNDLLIKRAYDSVSLDAKRLKAPIRFVSENPGLEYKGRKMRGEILLQPDKNGSVLIINRVPLEEYLFAVVPSEVPSSWPTEALKAQSICSRTYAVREMLNKKDAAYDVEATVNSQAYAGMDKENPRTTAAVRDTEGVLAVYDEDPIHMFFHSNSGGRTETPDQVWGGKRLPYLESVPSKFDEAGDNFVWKESLTQERMDSVLSSLGVGSVQSVQVLSRTPSGRVDLLEVIGKQGTSKIKGKEFRSLFGATVKSLRFGIKRDQDGFLIKGMGSGHGVGLSQWGSFGMAKQNYNYADIIRHYYQGIEFARITR